MPERRYLDEVELTGARHVARELLHGATIAAVVVTSVGAFLPATREWRPPPGPNIDDVGRHVDYAPAPELPFDSYFANGGIWMLVAIWLVAVQWLRTRGRGYGSGYKFGIAAVALPLAGLIPMLGLLMTRLEHANGHHVFWTGWAGILGCGVLVMVTEPLFHIAERRHLERDVDPEFPTARVV